MFKNLFPLRLATPLLRKPPHEPSTRSTDFASLTELLSKLSIFGFSLLSPKDQQDKIEQISNKLAAEDDNVGSLAAAAAGETKEDVRRKAFAMLFNKAPVVTRVDLFKEFTQKFFVERRMCEESRYAEFYLGLSIIWFKARCASDPRNLIQVVLGKAGVDDHIFEKLVNETEEDFKLRRFTESFKQLQFSSQEDIVEFIQDAVFRDLVDDVSNTFEMREDVSNTFEMREDVSNTGDSVSGNVAGITSRKRLCAGDSVSRLRICGNIISDRTHATNVGISSIGNGISRPFWEPLLEVIKMSIPDLRGPRGATATQGGGQGASTQGGQGTSQQ